MKLLDKLVLALKSAVGGAVADVVGEDLPAADKVEATRRLIDRAQARIDTLKADAERARKRGDADLAQRLDKDVAELQKTIHKTQQRLGQLEGREAAAPEIESGQSTRRDQRKDAEGVNDGLAARDEGAAKREDKTAVRDEIDSTRITDILKGDAKK